MNRFDFIAQKSIKPVVEKRPQVSAVMVNQVWKYKKTGTDVDPITILRVSNDGKSVFVDEFGVLPYEIDVSWLRKNYTLAAKNAKI